MGISELKTNKMPALPLASGLRTLQMQIIGQQKILKAVCTRTRQREKYGSTNLCLQNLCVFKTTDCIIGYQRRAFSKDTPPAPDSGMKRKPRSSTVLPRRS